MTDIDPAPGECDVAFGDRFNRWRCSIGWSVADMADMAGLSSATLYCWESGESSPTREAWEMVREHFNSVPVPAPLEFASSRLGKRRRRDVTPPPITVRRIDPPQSLETLRQALEHEFHGKRVTAHPECDFVVVFPHGESSSADIRQLEEDLAVTARWVVHEGKLALLVDRRGKSELADAITARLATDRLYVNVAVVGERVDVCLGPTNGETREPQGLFVEASALVGALQDAWQIYDDRRILVNVKMIRVSPK